MPWADIPRESVVLAPDGRPDILRGLIPPLFVHLARSGMWGLVGHPTGLFLAIGTAAPDEREDPETAAMRTIVERFPATEVIDE